MNNTSAPTESNITTLLDELYQSLCRFHASVHCIQGHLDGREVGRPAANLQRERTEIALAELLEDSIKDLREAYDALICRANAAREKTVTVAVLTLVMCIEQSHALAMGMLWLLDSGVDLDESFSRLSLGYTQGADARLELMFEKHRELEAILGFPAQKQAA